MKAKNNQKNSQQTICVNRRARHEYDILERFECGVVLLGWEVKSIRSGQASLANSYAVMRNCEAWVIGSHITPLPNVPEYLAPVADRSRKLLMKQKELDQLLGAVERKGLTIIPLSMYWKGRHVKIQLGLARGRKKHDKRQHEKAQDWQRKSARIVKTLQQKSDSSN